MNLGYGFSNRIEDKFESLVQNIVYEKLEIAPARPGGAHRCAVHPLGAHIGTQGDCVISNEDSR